MRMQRRWQCFEIPGPFRGFLKEAPCWELGSSEAGWGRCGGQGRRQPHSRTAPSSQTRLCLGAAASSPEEKATTNNYTSFSRLGCSGGSGLLTSCFGGCRGGSACWSCFCQESQQTPSKGRYPACGGRAIPQSLTRRWELQAAARPGLTIPGWDRPGPACELGKSPPSLCLQGTRFHLPPGRRRRWKSPALAAAWSSICSTDEESVAPPARKPLIPSCGRAIRRGAGSSPLPARRGCGSGPGAPGRSVAPHAISDLPKSAAYLCRLRAARARGSPARQPLPWLSFLTSGIWIIISAPGSFIT